MNKFSSVATQKPSSSPSAWANGPPPLQQPSTASLSRPPVSSFRSKVLSVKDGVSVRRGIAPSSSHRNSDLNFGTIEANGSSGSSAAASTAGAAPPAIRDPTRITPPTSKVPTAQPQPEASCAVPAQASSTTALTAASSTAAPSPTPSNASTAATASAAPPKRKLDANAFFEATPPAQPAPTSAAPPPNTSAAPPAPSAVPPSFHPKAPNTSVMAANVAANSPSERFPTLPPLVNHSAPYYHHSPQMANQQPPGGPDPVPGQMSGQAPYPPSQMPMGWQQPPYGDWYTYMNTKWYPHMHPAQQLQPPYMQPPGTPHQPFASALPPTQQPPTPANTMSPRTGPMPALPPQASSPAVPHPGAPQINTNLPPSVPSTPAPVRRSLTTRLTAGSREWVPSILGGSSPMIPSPGFPLPKKSNAIKISNPNTGEAVVLRPPDGGHSRTLSRDTAVVHESSPLRKAPIRMETQEEKRAREEKERKAKEELEAKKKKEAEDKLKKEEEEREAKWKAEEAERLKKEEEERLKKEAEEKKRQEEEAEKKRLEDEKRRQKEEEARKKKEEEERIQREAEEKARKEKEEQERKEREERERKEREEVEAAAAAKAEEEERLRKEAEEAAKFAAEAKAKEEAEEQKREEEEKEKLRTPSLTCTAFASNVATPASASPKPDWAVVQTPPTNSLLTTYSDDNFGQFISDMGPQPIHINGHFGDVFKGFHQTVGEVALKRLRIGGTGDEERIIRSFEREAKTWRCLEHPHILKFLGTLRYEGHLHFVSPFMKNGTLLQYVKTYEGVNRIRLLAEAASAIDYLHQEKEMVHGDIKASNLLVSDDNHVLLCDFGLTKDTAAQTSTTLKGAGTARWQSPELWDDGSKTFKSDVYAFSMTIVEILTGDRPFPHLFTDMAVFRAVYFQNERPERSPVGCNGISYENAWQVAEGCWPKLPEERMLMSEAFRRLREDSSLVSITVSTAGDCISGA